MTTPEDDLRARLRAQEAEIQTLRARLDAAAVLADSSERLRSLLDTAPNFILTLETDGRITFINRTDPHMTPAQVVGTSMLDWVPAADRPRLASALALIAAGGPVMTLELGGRGAHGEPTYFITRIGPLARDGRVVGLVAVATDISERVLAEQALHESEARLRSAAESLPFAFWVRDSDGRMVLQNRISLAAWGDQRGRGVGDLGLPDDLLAIARDNLARVMAGEVVDCEVALGDGAARRHVRAIMAPVRDAGAIRGVLGVDIDLTEQRRLEEQLFQAAKEESIGRLAGGVAHDFNNLLTSVLGHTELASRALPTAAPVQDHLRRVIESARRGAALTQQLLAFARKQVIHPRAIDLNLLLRQTGELLPVLLGEDIALALQLDPGLHPVVIDPVQAEQIVMNLAANARDAMPGGGRLHITTANVVIGADDARARPGLAAGAHVRVTIADSGSGMPPEVLARVFEPFFTTKPVGRGTGLGLATCYGIIRQNRGHIAAASGASGGSVFTIHLPAAPGTPTAPPTTTVTARPGRGHETILLVEDDAAIRDLLGDALVGQGYTVLIAADGEEALERIHTWGRSIDLLVTDVVMPRLGGHELARRLRAERPGLKILFASGYPGEPTAPAPGTASIAKPFTPTELAARVRQMLGG